MMLQIGIDGDDGNDVRSLVFRQSRMLGGAEIGGGFYYRVHITYYGSSVATSSGKET